MAGREDAAGGAAGQVGIQRVAVQHAAAVFVHQFLQRDAGGRQLDAGQPDPAADAEAAQPLAAVAAKAAEPARAALDDVTHPVQGLEVVLQRRAAKQADLRDIGRAHARHAALAFDAFDHGRLFSADIGAGAAAQFDQRQRTRRVGLQQREFGLEHGAAAMVFVAQVDITRLDADHLGRDQQALQEAVRIALQESAVLEGARLAFVDVHGHDARGRLLAHDAPFAPGRETGPTQAAQARVFHRLQHALRIVLAIDQRRGQRIPAVRTVGGVTGVIGRHLDLLRGR